MDLAQRGSCGWLRLDGFEQFVQLAVVKALQMGLQRGERQRWHLILQAGQGDADWSRQQILPLRGLLTKLQHWALHLSKRITQQFADGHPVDRRLAWGDALHQQVAGMRTPVPPSCRKRPSAEAEGRENRGMQATHEAKAQIMSQPRA